MEATLGFWARDMLAQQWGTKRALYLWQMKYGASSGCPGMRTPMEHDAITIDTQVVCTNGYDFDNGLLAGR